MFIWYDDEDISNYLEAFIKYDLLDKRKDCSYLLKGIGNRGDFPLELESNDRFSVMVTPAIGVGIPINYFFDKTNQPGKTHETRDVFDEFGLLVDQNSIIKILFPYSRDQSHWLIAEIRISAKDTLSDILVEIMAHDPFGGGGFRQQEFDILSQSIINKLKHIYVNRFIRCFNQNSPYNYARQVDSVSCGAIVAEELILLITGGVPSEQVWHAREIRDKHLDYLRKNLGENHQHFLRFDFRHGHKPELQFVQNKNKYEIAKSENLLITHLKQDLSDIPTITVEKLIEIALELDRGMYDCLPENWRNPGIAGLCAVRLLRDVAAVNEDKYSEEVKRFLREIDDVSENALKLLQSNKKNSSIKSSINNLYGYKGGFIASRYSDEKFKKIKQVIKELPTEGQLVYREKDGAFFVLVDNRYITEICNCNIEENISAPSHAIGWAHITLNERMALEKSREVWERVSKKWGEAASGMYKSPQAGIKYLNKVVAFEVIGGYKGSPKTNSRQFATSQLEVRIVKLQELIDEGIEVEIKDYKYHITFGEVVRKKYSRLSTINKITEVLNYSSLSKQLCDILQVNHFMPAIKSDIYNYTMQLRLLLPEIKLLLSEDSGLSLEHLAKKTQELDKVLYNYLPHSIRTPSLSGFIAMQIIYGFICDKEEIDAVRQYSQQVNAITKIVKDFLLTKLKEINLQFWIDQLFRIDNNFNRDQHEATRAKIRSTTIPLTLQEVLELTKLKPFSEEIENLFKSCDKINTLFENLKTAAETKQSDQFVACCLSQIGDFWKEKAEQIKIELEKYHSVTYNNCQDMLTYSLIFYNAALKAYERSGLENYIQDTKTKITIAFRRILTIAKNKSFEDDGSTEVSFVDSDDDNLKNLRDLRLNFYKELNELEKNLPLKEASDEELLKMAVTLQERTNKLVGEIKKFMGVLITQAMQLLGGAPDPDSYSFVGFGSLEKKTCTPYSDWEFAILLKEDTEQKRQYFRDLSYILQAKVINLRETPIHFSLFNYSFDHLTGKGFSYDLGGKTPLGRYYDDAGSEEQYGKLKYELIGAPHKLANYLDDYFFKVDKFLPIEVASCIHIFGKQDLTEEFEQLIKNKLSQVTERGKRNLYQERAITLLNEDLWRYTPQFRYYESGKIYDVKKEIYRITDRFVDSLAFFYGINQGNINDKIKILVERNFINPRAGEKLIIICGIANLLRLITYKYYNEQNDKAWVVGFSKGDQKHQKTESFYLELYKEFLKTFYYTAIPFCEKLHNWAKDQAIPLYDDVFYDCSDQIQAQVCIRLYEYQEAKKHLEQYLNLCKDNFNKLNTFRHLGFISRNLGELFSALKYYKDSLQAAIELDDSLAISEMLTNIGNICGQLGDYLEEEKLLKHALDISKNFYGEEHISVVVLLNNLGSLYNDVGNYPIARELLEQSLSILVRIRNYGKEHIWVTAVSHNLGNTYRYLGEYNKAKNLFEQALNKAILYYGEDHGEIAKILNDFGNSCIMLGDHIKAKKLLKQALDINIRHFGKDSEQVAINYDGLGNLYSAVDNYEEGKKLLEDALNIKLNFYENKEHMQIAITLHSLGNLLVNSGDYLTGQQLLEESLKIKVKLFGEESIPAATTLDVLGQLYIDLDRHEESNNLLQKALPIYIKYYGEQHIKVGLIYYKCAWNYALSGHKEHDNEKREGLLKEALNLLKKCVPIYIKYYGEQHVRVAEIYFRLSIVYCNLGNNEDRQQSLEKALEIYNNNPDAKKTCIKELFIVLNDLNNIYGAKDNYKDFYEKQTILLEQALELDVNCYEEPYVYVLPKMFDNLNKLYNRLKTDNRKETLLAKLFKLRLFLLHDKIFTNHETAKLFKEKIQQKNLTEEKEMIDFIVENGGNINAQEQDGMTIFMIACSLGHFKIIEELINKKADICTHNKRGATALHFAFTNHTPTILTYLLEQQICTIDVTDDDGDFPEAWAIQYDLVNNLRAACEYKTLGIERIKQDTDFAKEFKAQECENYLSTRLKSLTI